MHAIGCRSDRVEWGRDAAELAFGVTRSSCMDSMMPQSASRKPAADAAAGEDRARAPGRAVPLGESLISALSRRFDHGRGDSGQEPRGRWVTTPDSRQLPSNSPQKRHEAPPPSAKFDGTHRINTASWMKMRMILWIRPSRPTLLREAVWRTYICESTRPRSKGESEGSDEVDWEQTGRTLGAREKPTCSCKRPSSGIPAWPRIAPRQPPGCAGPWGSPGG